MKNYTFIKNVEGNITINLESYNFATPSRKFRISHGVESIIIPEVYALGLFVSPSALNQRDLGCFYVKEEKELNEALVKAGLGGVDEVKMPLLRSDIVTMLNKEDIKAIEELLERGNPIEINNMTSIARGLMNSLTAKTKSAIEKGLGAVLEIGEE